MTHELELVSAFLVGLLGSVHCIGMCGGIAGLLGAPGAGAGRVRRLFNTVGYNVGRIASYGIAGFIVGTAGSGVYDLFPMTRVAEVGLLVSGGFMILLGLYLAGWWRALAGVERAGGVLWKRIQPLTRHLLPVRSPWQAVPLGMLWGWLPCGLVYATLVWALFAADPMYSMAIMIAFGAGTLPMLLALGGIAGRLDRLRRHPLARQVAGALVIAFGVATFVGWIHPVHAVDHPVDAICTTRG